MLPQNCNNLNYDLTLGISKFIDHVPHQHGSYMFIDTLFISKIKFGLKSKQCESEAVFFCQLQKPLASYISRY